MLNQSLLWSSSGTMLKKMEAWRRQRLHVQLIRWETKVWESFLFIDWKLILYKWGVPYIHEHVVLLLTYMNCFLTNRKKGVTNIRNLYISWIHQQILCIHQQLNIMWFFGSQIVFYNWWGCQFASGTTHEDGSGRDQSNKRVLHRVCRLFYNYPCGLLFGLLYVGFYRG